MSSSDINERVRAIIAGAAPEWDWRSEIRFKQMIDFATKEREAAAREFIEKVNEKFDAALYDLDTAAVYVGSTRAFMRESYREMFNKDLEGSDS